MVNMLAINWSEEFLDWQRKVEMDAENEKRISKQIKEMDETIEFIGAQNIPTDGLKMELELLKHSLATHRKTCILDTIL